MENGQNAYGVWILPHTKTTRKMKEEVVIRGNQSR